MTRKKKKKIQGLADTLAAWKVNQKPRAGPHRDELIFFSERDKEHQVYSKLGGKRTSRLLDVPRSQLVWGQSESNLFW